MNPVAACARTHNQHRVPNPFRNGRYGLPLLHNPYTHGIHQRVPLVGLIKIDLTSHHRNSKRVSIIGDTPHHSIEQIPDAWLLHRPETKRI